MATSQRSAAAVLFFAACAAAVCIGGAALESPRVAATAAGSAPRALSSSWPAASPAARRAAAVAHLRMPVLPLPSAALSRGPAAVPATHTVVAGDTLWAIAVSSGVRVEALAAANGLTEETILPLGRVLKVPRPGTMVAARALTPRPAVSTVATRGSVSSRSGAAASAPPLPSRNGAWHLALRWPSGGIVTSRFGWRVHPIFGGREFHTGMDIATRYGSPVVAARAGIVRFVGWKSGYGRIVILDHDGGIETAYSHLSAMLVSPGQRVAQGQTIGRIGSSGWSTGPHLFFEVRRNGVPLDPARYLN